MCAVIGCWAFDVGCWMFPVFMGKMRFLSSVRRFEIVRSAACSNNRLSMSNTSTQYESHLRMQASCAASDPGLCYVVGSGPAGVACAKALLDAGRRVRMLDAGLTLEPDREGLVEKLKRSRPEEWTPADLATYQAGMNPDVGGVPLKLVYGSDFAYREADEHLGRSLRSSRPAPVPRQGRDEQCLGCGHDALPGQRCG